MFFGSKTATGRPSRCRASRVSSTRSGWVDVARTGPAQLRTSGGRTSSSFRCHRTDDPACLVGTDQEIDPLRRCEVPSEEPNRED